MRGTVLPYIEEPALDLGFYRLEAFGVLVVAAIVVQFRLVLWRAPHFGIERETASSLLAWAIGLGLVGAHVFDVIAYQPERLFSDPLYLFAIWSSLSSFGGMLGGLGGLLWVMHRRHMTTARMLAFVDCLIWALPFTLAVGRLGCGLKHDHPGVLSNHWLAVDFPDGARFDLGLLESFYAAGIAVLFAFLGRQTWPSGFFLGLFFALYGPIRFQMDVLRIHEARYLGWTPGQYASVAATILGLGVLLAIWRRRPATAT